MVIQIKLSNFYSIKEEVILDFEAANLRTKLSKDLEANCIDFNGDKILKSLAVYGANASGKSNIIKTIRFCHAMVYDSHKHNEDVTFNFQPFKSNSKNTPSTYYIDFVAEEVEYEYSFSLTPERIIQESLYHYPNGKRAKVFTRDERKGEEKRDKYSFGTAVIKRPYDVAESTSNKTLFISRASQMDRRIPKIIFRYFHEKFLLRHTQWVNANLEELLNEYKSDLLLALSYADSDIVDFKIQKRTEKGKHLRANFDTEEFSVEDEERKILDIETSHRCFEDKAFKMSEESLGTQKLFVLMLSILEVIKNEKVLLVDELEDSLHPAIVEYIISLFHRSKGSQLLFSTHNTNLLNLKKFRRDQIWFVNKKVEGSSELYSLSDFKDFRENMDLEKAYLQGRFESIPVINELSSDLMPSQEA
ncbi:MAG: ATP-binding protein [Bacteroidetes bacterium]|nr:ATP-binding protein [Bacteroidota bacterium]